MTGFEPATFDTACINCSSAELHSLARVAVRLPRIYLARSTSVVTRGALGPGDRSLAAMSVVALAVTLGAGPRGLELLLLVGLVHYVHLSTW